METWTDLWTISMKIYNEKDFIDIIRKDLNPLSKEDFFKTKQLGELWDKQSLMILGEIY